MIAAHLTGLLSKKVDFKPWQLSVIKAVLESKNSIVIQPTGSGNSLCYHAVSMCCLWKIDNSHCPNNQPHPLQTNGTDCGIYAIANGQELCAGRIPASCSWVGHKMRAHLLKCLDVGKLTSFPRH